MLTSAAYGQEDGFTLMELIVAILVAAVVGTVAVGGLVAGMRASVSTHDRIDAFSQIQVTVERMAREVRAADPVEIAESGQIRLRVLRDQRCTQFTYRRNGPDLEVTQLPLGGPACDAPGTATTSIAVNDVTAPVFTYRDAQGVLTSDPAEVAVVEISIVRAFDRQPSVTVETVVHVRNAA